MQNKKDQKYIFNCDSCDRKINVSENKLVKLLRLIVDIYTRPPTVHMGENGPTCLICLDERIEKECDKMRQTVLNADQDPNELFKLPMPEYIRYSNTISWS